MTAKDLIKKYNIQYHTDTTLQVGRKPSATDLQAIKDNKPEILAILIAEKKAKDDAREAREKAIAGIDGLDALRKAIDAEYAYSREVNRRFEDESLSSFMPGKPASSDDLKKQYPRAAAYIKAENWTMSGNVDKYSAGQKALERIINDENHVTVIAEMEAEWSQAAHEAMMRD